ncbi:MAG TPA: ABC transporter substrate-binding protein [Mycetocola sp.]|jgi:ribose transport system substrate-binding protein|uniref:ABC transporter substrate-binding protein n=1 Tax=Mycetocola sp. TaxID=1871042 RepID=UPI0026120A1B|nr:ABC transporter substrate-binding protein [Mycetocola sp.]MCU1419930.1 LacI family transcriptional regulator [Mycetocola sp.]MCU1561095.1 LacI family transcriptional regulator [Mycetocola sp.]HEV7849614.1 ABC transporter substrate-binding protein [Mycetocola sp.]
MKTGKKVAALAAAAAVALSLAGCSNGGGGGTAESSGSGEGDIQIALVSKGFQHQFWQAVKQGAEQRAEELGVSVTFDGPAAETEIDGQLQMLQAAIDKKPDAIGFAALDPEACIPLYDAAESAGIPVVEFDAGCSSEYGQSIAKTDSLGAGALAADHMAELIGGEGEVAIVGHSQINSTGVERRDGFVDQMEAEYPDIEIVDIQYGDGDHLKSADIAKAMIQAHPNLKGIYGTNEGSAIGVVNAVGELGLESGELTVVGFDSGQAQIDAIENGLMAGAITQNPIGIGEEVVQAAYDIINGETPEEVIDTGYFWYDKDNMDDEEIAAVLYK